MSRLTILIPLQRDFSIEVFEETLASVLVCLPANSEVVVASAASYDDPWETAKDGVTFLSCPDALSLQALVNAGLRKATGEIVHILMPGVEAVTGWTEKPLAHFDSPEVGMVIPRLQPRQTEHGLSKNHNNSFDALPILRHFSFSPLPRLTVIPHLAALFVRRHVLLDIGGLVEGGLLQLAYATAAIAFHSQGWQTRVEDSSEMLVRPEFLPCKTARCVPLRHRQANFKEQKGTFGLLGQFLATILAEVLRCWPKFSASSSSRSDALSGKKTPPSGAAALSFDDEERDMARKAA